MLAQYKFAFAPALNDCLQLPQFVRYARRLEIPPENGVLAKLIEVVIKLVDFQDHFLNGQETHDDKFHFFRETF